MNLLSECIECYDQPKGSVSDVVTITAEGLEMRKMIINDKERDKNRKKKDPNSVRTARRPKVELMPVHIQAIQIQWLAGNMETDGRTHTCTHTQTRVRQSSAMNSDSDF